MLHCLIRVAAGAFTCGCKSPLVEVACSLANLGSRSIQCDPILSWQICSTGQFFSGSLDGVAVKVVPFCPSVNSVLWYVSRVDTFSCHKAASRLKSTSRWDVARKGMPVVVFLFVLLCSQLGFTSNVRWRYACQSVDSWQGSWPQSAGDDATGIIQLWVYVLGVARLCPYWRTVLCCGVAECQSC